MKPPQTRKSDMEIGEVYFWTSTIVEWKRLFKNDSYKQVVIDCLKNLVERKCIAVYGFVIMPNHVHFIWEMLTKNGKEMPDTSFTKFTAHEFKRDLKEKYPQVLEIFKTNKNDREYQFWQRDALAIRVFLPELVLQKLNYSHNNPLQDHWKLADSPENYKWSSAKFYETGIDEFGFLTHYLDRK